MSDGALIGYSSLQRRIGAVGSLGMTSALMRRLVTAGIRETKFEVPRRTGNLGRSIHAGEITPELGQVIASTSYAAAVEFGSRAHDIVPVHATALRWAATGAGRRLTGSPTKAAQRGANGGVAFAKRVHIPAIPANPFMERGLAKAVTTSGAGGLLDLVITAWNTGGTPK